MPIITVTCSGKGDNQCPIPLIVTTCNQTKTGFDVTFFNTKDDWVVGQPKFNWIAIGPK